MLFFLYFKTQSWDHAETTNIMEWQKKRQEAFTVLVALSRDHFDRHVKYHACLDLLVVLQHSLNLMKLTSIYVSCKPKAESDIINISFKFTRVVSMAAGKRSRDPLIHIFHVQSTGQSLILNSICIV